MSNIPIQPFPVSQPVETATTFSYRVVDFVASTSITFACFLMDSNGRILSNQNILVGGDDYTAWGNDDTYIVNYLSNKMGVSISS